MSFDDDKMGPGDRTLIEEVESFLKEKKPSSMSEEGRLKKEKIDLSQEWNRQAQNLASLFALELKFKTFKDYIATLPKFEPQPEEYGGRLDIPLIVETRVPLERMLKLAGVDADSSVDSIACWKEEDQFKTPNNSPYTTWVNDGTPNLWKSVKKVRQSLRDDERGANIYDGIALYVKDPKILDNHGLVLPGFSRVDSNGVPVLQYSNGKLGLGSIWIDSGVGVLLGSVVAGRKINVLALTS